MIYFRVPTQVGLPSSIPTTTCTIKQERVNMSATACQQLIYCKCRSRVRVHVKELLKSTHSFPHKEEQIFDLRGY